MIGKKEYTTMEHYSAIKRLKYCNKLQHDELENIQSGRSQT
jgi:hypothetical protein